MTADASAASGVPPDTTVALAFFPFSGGMSKALLFPPATPFHSP